MHAQAGGGIDLNDAAALVFERLEDGVAHHVDTGDVEADGLCGSHRRGGEVGMHVVGDVGGGAAGRQVGVVAQDDADAARRHAVGRVTLFGQAGEGDLVEADLGQRRGVAIGAARVAIDDVDQFADGMCAVADDQRRVAPGSGDQLVADDQKAPVVAGQVFLDHDVVAELDGDAVSLAHLLLARQIDRDALALVAILRLDDDRQAHFLGRYPRVVLVLHRAAVGHGDAGRVQQLLGQFLVLGDGFGNGTGETGFGGLDALLLAAPAELDKAALRQAAEGNAAGGGGRDDGAGRGAEADVLVQIAQFLQRAVKIEGRVVECGQAELFGMFEGQAADIFLGVFDNHLIDAGIHRLRGAAEGDRAAGLGLQAQGAEFQRVRDGNRVEVVGGNQVAEFREALAQAGFEAGQVGDGGFGTVAADDGLDGSVAAPQVGAAQGANAGNVHDAMFLVISAVPHAAASWPESATGLPVPAGRGRRS